MVQNTVKSYLELLRAHLTHPGKNWFTGGAQLPLPVARWQCGNAIAGLVILFEIEMENISGTLTICLPYAAIQPIIPKLRAQFQSEEQEVDNVWVRRLRMELMTTEIELVAELGTTVVTPQDLMNYKVGDTIMLGNDVSAPLELKVEQITKFKGFPGESRGNKAIQLTETIEREG